MALFSFLYHCKAIKHTVESEFRVRRYEHVLQIYHNLTFATLSHPRLRGAPRSRLSWMQHGDKMAAVAGNNVKYLTFDEKYARRNMYVSQQR